MLNGQQIKVLFRLIELVAVFTAPAEVFRLQSALAKGTEQHRHSIITSTEVHSVRTVIESAKPRSLTEALQDSFSVVYGTELHEIR